MATDETEDDLAAALAMSMASPSQPSPAGQAVNALRDVSASERAEAGTVQVLSTLLGNLVKSPGEEKFRKVKLTNAKIAKALSCKGAEELLLAAGFARVGENLEVPGDRAPAELQAAAQIALNELGALMPSSFKLSAQLRAEGEVRCVTALSSGGLAFGAMDNTVRLWPTCDWTSSPQALLGHERRAGVDGVLAVTSGIDGSDLVSAGRDGKIIAWKGGAQAFLMQGHGEGVTATGSNLHVVSCLSRYADGRLISGGWDKSVRVWNSDKQELMLEGNDYAVNAVAGLPSGDIAVASGYESIGIWRGTEKRLSLKITTVVRALCSGGGALVASGDNEGFFRIWDTESGKQVAERKLSSAYLLSVARSESGEFAAGAVNGAVTILALEGTSLRVVEVLQHCGDVFGMAFLANGDLAAACGDSSCVVWSRDASRLASQLVQQDFEARAKALAVAQAEADAAEKSAASSKSATYDFSFPVDFGPKKFSLSWNRGEEPKAIADRFVRENGIDPKHTGDVIAFVMDTMQKHAGGSAVGGNTGGNKDFNFPVEVADGRKLNISWNRGDDPEQVAIQFAQQNGGIHMNEIPDIVNFVRQASGGPAQAAPAAPAAHTVSPAVQQQALQQVMEMGFEAATARMVLESTNWNVEAAIARLLG